MDPYNEKRRELFIKTISFLKQHCRVLVVPIGEPLVANTPRLNELEAKNVTAAIKGCIKCKSVKIFRKKFPTEVNPHISRLKATIDNIFEVIKSNQNIDHLDIAAWGNLIIFY
jgi:hypothetical protein